MTAHNLTPREQEAARLAVEGRTNKQVAEKMGLTAPTVEQYLHRAYSKLGVSNRGQLHLASVKVTDPESL